ncbi:MULTISPECIES: LysR substrate-binding domain-containing protein [Saccharothrix]|uniref:LysR substrate-binding domain-containing protein n=1 Tax=Saccharothrix TaxID=2071 RepID=UPI00093C39A6|nr:LysR substrate-binding domain-containing protein [Saccharothrix sp. CB00851]OKI36422.1 LysR family transcriptional regulator [Saccharothrix sp. CB00851]
MARPDQRAAVVGVHGSRHLAEHLMVAAGHDPGDFEFGQYDVTDPFRLLRDGTFDLMLIKYSPREPDIAYSRPLMFDGRAVFVGADHPLAALDSVSVEDVADYDAFARPGTFPPDVWDEVVPPRTPAGVPIRRVHPMTTIEAMVSILATTKAVHLSFQSLDAVLPPRVRVVPVRDLPAAPVRLAFPRDKALRPQAAAFVADAESSVAR